MTKNRKQRIYDLTGGRGGRRGNGDRGRGGGGGNHYQCKRPYKGGSGGLQERGGSGSSDKHVQLNDHGNLLHGIDWVKDKFYEPGFHAKFTSEQNTQLNEL